MPKEDEEEKEEETEEPEEPADSESTFSRAVKLASEDPEAFVNEVKRLGQTFGAKAEEAYAEVQKRDAKDARRGLRNGFIQGIAKRIRREFKF